MTKTIVVYGATGFLGRLVVRELRSRGVACVLGGRHASRLAAMAAGDDGASTRTAAVDDPAALRAMLTDAAVVINCAGPASVCAEPLIRAALATGVHYVDAAGEQSFIGHAFDAYGADASRQGLAIVPGFGFDYAIGDGLARLVAAPCGAIENVTVAYAISGSAVAGNSAEFAVSTPRGREVVYRNGRWQGVPLEADRGSFQFPEPLGRLQMSRYGSGEVVMIPRHTKTNRVTTLITSSSLLPWPALLPVFPYLRPAVALALRTPLKRVLALGVRHRSDPKPVSDPKPPSFTIGVEVTDTRGRLRRGFARGGDFHQATAAILAYGATMLARFEWARVGVLCPSDIDPIGLFEDLRRYGFSWWIEPDVDPRASTAASPHTP